MYRIKLSRAYPDRVRRRAVEDQLPLLQYTCNEIGDTGCYDEAALARNVWGRLEIK